MTFYCFRDEKCEWNKQIRDFTIEYNKQFGTNYNLSKCLDISNEKEAQPEAQPEVLLEDKHEKPIVIECKKLVWPKEYFKKHRLIHNFDNTFRKSFYQFIAPLLVPDYYQLGVNEYDITKQKEKQIDFIATSVAKQIKECIEKENKTDFKKSFLTGKFNNIPWSFTCLDDHEHDFNIPAFKPQLKLYFAFDDFQILNPYTKKSPEFQNHIYQQILTYINKTQKKFEIYSDHIKILILELCGYPFSPLDRDVVDDLINNIKIPSYINQIWVAEAFPVDDYSDTNVFYQLI